MKLAVQDFSLSIISTFLLFSTVVTPGLSNTEVVSRFIDDQLGDLVTGEIPIYYPSNDWQEGANCNDCSFQLNPQQMQQVFNHTMHFTSRFGGDLVRTVALNFEGFALDVYCIIPNAVDPLQTISSYDLTFTLDGQSLSQTFVHQSDQSGNYLFNVSVLSLNGLVQGPHELAMTAPQSINSTILFDYARYLTTTSSTPSASTVPSKGPSTIVIVGGVVGGVVFGSIVTLMLVFVILRRRKRKEHLRQPISLSSSDDADITVARPAFLNPSTVTQSSLLTTTRDKLPQTLPVTSMRTVNAGQARGENESMDQLSRPAKNLARQPRLLQTQLLRPPTYRFEG
ncbi:hypothetical protein GYMLUDRAFT_72288 [Collybiopsis luxurians FD-317 M1]|uniref:Transmembrane protein n=1 Tax=Collybiopsis luxurians FD-317 M1 TaxID=944289 RepID=A0A0D0C4L0_9AGAR|nr:hypothetical protein GYMLUDRAFT_72288 [Collybiopsis luxurians FD-317 M1]